MWLSGLQKLTLLDFPGKVACTIFTAGCDFRCPFCHNATLVLPDRAPEPVSEEEVFQYLEKRRGLLDGICITGGEPLLQNDIASFLVKVRLMGYQVKLDTNGTRPEKLRKLLEDGLINYVAMDIKNSPERYAETAGVNGFDIAPVRESAALLLSGQTPCEFRTTVVLEFHRLQDMIGIGQWIRGAKQYYLQGFKDSGDLIMHGLHAVSQAEMLDMADAVRPYIPNVQIRGI